MVTNIDVREELIRCFTAAHKEFMQKGADALGIQDTEEELKVKMRALIRMKFQKVESDF